MKSWLSGIGSCCWWHSITSCWLHTFAPFFFLFHWLHVLFAIQFIQLFVCSATSTVTVSKQHSPHTAYLSPAFSAVKNKLGNWNHFYAFHAWKLLTQFSHFVGVRTPSPLLHSFFQCFLCLKIHRSQKGCRAMYECVYIKK